MLRLDISDVISRYVSLKKSGVNLVGLCPFHSEKSPSFIVSNKKKIYHCFGCGAHGDSITFIMKYLGLSFTDAVKSLSSEVGMVVPDEDKRNGFFLSSEQKKENACFNIMSKAQIFYHVSLKSFPKALNYLKKRGLDNKIIDFFGLGWSGIENNFLSNCFENYNDNLLSEVGLIIDSNRRYDRFRQRIMFPIRNYYGKVVGFGARSIFENIKPKYLNSPETILFSKRNELYGLWEARNSIRKEEFVLVVEGYMDVITLSQHGLTNVVATLGTSISTENIKRLLSITGKIIFSFDGDIAGQNASWRTLLSCLEELHDGVEIRFLTLNDSKDPDSHVLLYGIHSFRNYINSSIPLSKFFINELLKKHNILEVEGRMSYWHEASELLNKMPLNTLRTQIEKEILQLLKFTEEDRIMLVNSKVKNSNFNYTNEVVFNKKVVNKLKKGFDFSNISENNRLKHIPSLANHLFSLLIFNLNLIDEMVCNQQLEILDRNPELKHVRDLILIVQNNNIKNLNELKKILSKDSELYSIVSSLEKNRTFERNLPDPIREWEDALLLIESNALKEEINSLIINGLVSEKDVTRYKELSKRLIIIKNINEN